MALAPLPARVRSGRNRLAAPLLAVLLAGSACGGGADVDGSVESAADSTAVEAAPSTASATESVGSDESAASPTPPPSAGLAAMVQALPPAPIGDDALRDRDRDERAAARPRLLTIPDLGIDGATVIDVGVDPVGDLEVPPADQVGWYRHGPAPGEAGSAVLAAHIAYDGRDGVFVRLADVQPGATVEVEDEAGRLSRYTVEAVERHAKEALPEDLVYARDGASRLVLVTCGGRFDPERRSYDDNIVVVAVPV